VLVCDVFHKILCDTLGVCTYVHVCMCGTLCAMILIAHLAHAVVRNGPEQGRHLLGALAAHHADHEQVVPVLIHVPAHRVLRVGARGLRLDHDRVAVRRQPRHELRLKVPPERGGVHLAREILCACVRACMHACGVRACVPSVPAPAAAHNAHEDMQPSRLQAAIATGAPLVASAMWSTVRWLFAPVIASATSNACWADFDPSTATQMRLHKGLAGVAAAMVFVVTCVGNHGRASCPGRGGRPA
jgi:hypothetical protein